jgi:hypothetical protein
MENTPVVLGQLDDTDIVKLIVYLARKLPEEKLPELLKQLSKVKEVKPT